jgi:uncharacterized alkaline shock family protein YloU
MRLINFIVISFYTLVFLAIGFFLICLSVGLITLPEVLNNITQFYESSNLSLMITGIVGGLSVLISLLFIIHLLEGIFRKERGILVSGAGGITSVSLLAIEDIIRRAGNQFLDVREIKPRVVIKKRGLNVSAIVILYSGVNIPEITERLQSSIRERLQHVLGIESEIKVKIHIIKIIEKSKKDLKKEGPTRQMELGR